MLIGYYLAVVAYIFMLAENTNFTPSWTICLPLIGIILNWLAIRGIGADEVVEELNKVKGNLSKMLVAKIINETKINSTEKGGAE